MSKLSDFNTCPQIQKCPYKIIESTVQNICQQPAREQFGGSFYIDFQTNFLYDDICQQEIEDVAYDYKNFSKPYTKFFKNDK